MRKYFYLLSLLVAPAHGLWSQTADAVEVAAKVTAYKQDIRGPYRDLRWFCTDGSTRAPRDPCPEEIGPGAQHARYKDEVLALGKTNHLYLGQILTGTEPEAFWDKAYNHSRLKQYQLGKYLEGVDDGWILRKAQYYRGAIQSEDEAAWGRAFYLWLLDKPEILQNEFFLVRQSLKDIPHSGDDNLSQRMRSQSKVISDVYAPFMDLRVKIHGQPDSGDIGRVRSFRQKHAASMPADMLEELDKLVTTLTEFYRPVDLENRLAGMPMLKSGPLAQTIGDYAEAISQSKDAAYRSRLAAELILEIRKRIAEDSRPGARLQMLDLSLELEELLFKNSPEWEPVTLAQGLDKICYLGAAAAGAGYIELWEWEELQGSLGSFNREELKLGELTQVLEDARALVEWSAAMVKANYGDVVSAYASFEPLAHGFIDDQIRGSIALHLGKSVGTLGNFLARESRLTNNVMGIGNQTSIRGLNPGYALGELVVIGGGSDDIEVSPQKIYIFERSPSDLKPVAGIATVAEGNLVSHVQLLARNLGIPNAALSGEDLQALKKYDGQRVFYAVANRGNVILKQESQMTAMEKALFEKKERSEDRIAVPVEKIRLDQDKILNMREVDASDSGILCGPKAANLGQLKKLFPEHVVEGLVIPFGIFRDHMNLPMPGQAVTYWEFLNSIFRRAGTMRNEGTPEPEVENFQLRQLEILREAIKQMELKSSFVESLEQEFGQVFGKPLGELAVFLRSDTNMEDLKDFTGAGLNLTVFNVAERQKIINGIKDVWASPYTERSFKWRQRYLSNPENVFPSILIIPSVDVDYSGVLITKGINTGGEDDLTVAFSRGAGGAVDGQAAETYLIGKDAGHRLLAPAREPFLNRLPPTGGTDRQATTFERPVLSKANIEQIRDMARNIRSRLPAATGSDYDGAYDVELGFRENKLWLFQIRPFVENKKALSSGYLESISPKADNNRRISLSTPIQ